MSVSIEMMDAGTRLRMRGDIETVLDVPSDDVARRFLLAFSDGTLLEGSQAEQFCHFRVAQAGAGIVYLDADRAAVHWQVEWATLASVGAAAIASRQAEDLPLFPDLRTAQLGAAQARSEHAN